MGNVVAVGNVTDPGQGHTGGESLREAWQPTPHNILLSIHVGFLLRLTSAVL